MLSPSFFHTQSNSVCISHHLVMINMCRNRCRLSFHSSIPWCNPLLCSALSPDLSLSLLPGPHKYIHAHIIFVHLTGYKYIWSWTAHTLSHTFSITNAYKIQQKTMLETKFTGGTFHKKHQFKWCTFVHVLYKVKNYSTI